MTSKVIGRSKGEAFNPKETVPAVKLLRKVKQSGENIKEEELPHIYSASSQTFSWTRFNVLLERCVSGEAFIITSARVKEKHAPLA